MTNETWLKLPENLRDEQAKLFLTLDKVTEINKLCVIKFDGFHVVVNSESLFCKFFNTEEDAVNYALDNFNLSHKLITGNIQDNPTEQ